MRRSVVLTSVLAVSTAVFGACQNTKTDVPNKPASTPAPVSTVTPAPATPAPTGSPTTAKPGTTPEVKDAKKVDDKAVNKDAKPASTETPKAK
jgi:hypothetical protein